MRLFILTAFISFFSLSAFAQNENAAVKQVISLRLQKMVIVEKSVAPLDKTSPESPALVKIQSNEQWTITAIKAGNYTKSVIAKRVNDYIPAANKVVDSGIVYTLSKV
jgi:hypothetical protein